MINETLKRFRSETPSYFKRVRNFGIALGGLAFTLLMYEDKLPEVIVPACKYALAVGTTMSFLAQATKDDAKPNEINRPYTEA